MRVFWQHPGRSNQKTPRHPEVNQEDEATLEPDNQILSAALDARSALALELSGYLAGIHRPCEPLVEDRDHPQRPAGEDRRQLGPDGLDLGKLGHAR